MMSYNWKQWLGEVVDGDFPLHQYLGASEHDAVFLTERVGKDPSRAAIKLVPVEFTDPDRQLAGWRTVQQLSNPHLLRIFESGRTQLAGTDIVYVVMEYADEDLSQILPERALNESECRDTLTALLDALQYLHRQSLVHGELRPTNIMAVGDKVMLSSDTVQPSGPPLVKTSQASTPYDAPEIPTRGVSPASDMWGLGATTLEMLTQHPQAWDPSNTNDPVLPNLPEPFASIVRNSLRVDPQQRWMLAQVAQALNPVAKSAPAVAPVAKSTPSPTTRKEIAQPVARESKRSLFPIIAVAVVVLALIGYFLTRHSAEPQSEQSQTTSAPAAQDPAALPSVPAASAPTTAPTPAEPAPETTASKEGTVLHRELPSVSSQARHSIHGTVRVNVKVAVDASGNVTRTTFEKQGPSRYFAQLASESAREWKFAPPQSNGKAEASNWILRYQFRRDGTSVEPSQENP